VKPTGFFGLDGQLDRSVDESGGFFVHEISHNINAIGDKKLNGEKMKKNNETQPLARDNPTRASWNAYNHQRFAVSQ